jgi:hypothetical protein
MFMSRHQTTRQNHYIQIANKSFENVAKFKYLETTVTNLIHKENKSGLNLENKCYHSKENLLSSRLLFEIVKIKIQSAIFTYRFVWM